MDEPGVDVRDARAAEALEWVEANREEWTDGPPPDRQQVWNWIEALTMPGSGRSTLGGNVPGTGFWTVDELERPANPLGAEGVKSRPALRDPDGGAWCSWLNLERLDSLRDQLAAGAGVMDPDAGGPWAAGYRSGYGQGRKDEVTRRMTEAQAVVGQVLVSEPDPRLDEVLAILRGEPWPAGDWRFALASELGRAMAEMPANLHDDVRVDLAITPRISTTSWLRMGDLRRFAADAASNLSARAEADRADDVTELRGVWHDVDDGQHVIHHDGLTDDCPIEPCASIQRDDGADDGPLVIWTDTRPERPNRREDVALGDLPSGWYWRSYRLADQAWFAGPHESAEAALRYPGYPLPPGDEVGWQGAWPLEPDESPYLDPVPGVDRVDLGHLRDLNARGAVSDAELAEWEARVEAGTAVVVEPTIGTLEVAEDARVPGAITVLEPAVADLRAWRDRKRLDYGPRCSPRFPEGTTTWRWVDALLKDVDEALLSAGRAGEDRASRLVVEVDSVWEQGGTMCRVVQSEPHAVWARMLVDTDQPEPEPFKLPLPAFLMHWTPAGEPEEGESAVDEPGVSSRLTGVASLRHGDPLPEGWRLGGPGFSVLSPRQSAAADPLAACEPAPTWAPPPVALTPDPAMMMATRHGIPVSESRPFSHWLARFQQWVADVAEHFGYPSPDREGGTAPLGTSRRGEGYQPATVTPVEDLPAPRDPGPAEPISEDESKCAGCAGPGGIFGCDEHRPRRTITDRPQA